MVVNKPKSAFRTISEVAEEIDVAPHVLRFWETKFPQLKPMKRNGGRRYFRPDDVEFLQKIRFYLYDKRYTIEGVQKLIKEKGLKYLLGDEIQKDFIEMLGDNITLNEENKTVLSILVNELKTMRDKLEENLGEAE